MKFKYSISLLVCSVLCYLLFRVAFMSPSWAENRTIGHDVSGYYLYLPAYFLYDDLKGLNFIADIEKKYPSSHRNWSIASNGNKVIKYPIGMSILYAPSFGLAHFFADRWGFEQDGYSFPYQYFLAIYGVFFCCIGLWIIRACLLHYFEDWVVGLTLVLLVVSTNYLNYASLSPSMTHGYLFTMYALLIWLTIQWHQQQKWFFALSIGVIYGLMVIVCPTEIIALLIPLLWGIYNRQTLEEKITLLWQHKSQVALLSMATISIGLFQLGYWKAVSGDWLYYSYDEQGFSFLSPHILDGLFSFKKGWLIYTPIMVFAIGGFWQLWRKKPQLFGALFAFFLLNIYIIYSWDIWWYGGSIGSRAVVQSYAIMVFPLAAFINWIFTQKRRWLAVVWGAMALICIDLNLMQVWQSNSKGGGWHAEYMTRAYYFSIIGSTQAKPEDRKYLDVGRRIRDTRGMEFRQLYFEDFDGIEDSSFMRTKKYKFGGKYAGVINAENSKGLVYDISLKSIQPSSKAWIRAGLQIFFTKKEWKEWKMTSLVMEFWRDNELIESRPMRLQWLTNTWTWHHAYFERPIPRKMRGNLQDNDVLKVYFKHHGSTKDLYIDDFAVELIEP